MTLFFLAAGFGSGLCWMVYYLLGHYHAVEKDKLSIIQNIRDPSLISCLNEGDYLIPTGYKVLFQGLFDHGLIPKCSDFVFLGGGLGRTFSFNTAKPGKKIKIVLNISAKLFAISQDMIVRDRIDQKVETYEKRWDLVNSWVQKSSFTSIRTCSEVLEDKAKFIEELSRRINIGLTEIGFECTKIHVASIFTMIEID